MGNSNKNPRNVLLQHYERTKSALIASTERDEYLLRAGRLLAIAGILQECRHNGNGTDPILADHWTNDAMRTIRDNRPGLRLEAMK